jgi:DNA adenine methylase
MSYIKSPFCRQGNKHIILKEIIDVIPQHKIYCELFAGSAVLFFNKEKAQINILNDLDKEVTDRLKLLKKAPLNKDLYYNNFNNLNDIKKFYEKPHENIEDKILYYKIKACNGFGSIPVKKVEEIYNPDNPYNIVKNIDFYKNQLKNVKIFNKDYSLIIKQYDSNETFFFIDPPYENTDKRYYNESQFDYEKLAYILKNIKGLFLLTLNDSKYIRNIFKEFIIKKINVKSQGWRKNNKHIVRKELFIMNYTLNKI